MREIARVQPGGTLAILFNQADGKIERRCRRRSATRSIRSRSLEAARVHRAQRTLADTVPRPVRTVHGGVPECGRARPRGLLANVASWSTVAGLSDAERDRLLERLSALLPGSYRHPLSTDLYLTRFPKEADMNAADVDRWLDAYVSAWRSNERSQIEALFTEDARYRYHP